MGQRDSDIAYIQALADRSWMEAERNLSDFDDLAAKLNRKTNPTDEDLLMKMAANLIVGEVNLRRCLRVIGEGDATNEDS